MVKGVDMRKLELYRIEVEEESGRTYTAMRWSKSPEFVKECASEIAREFTPPLTVTVTRERELVGRRVLLPGRAKNWTRY